MLGGGSWRSAQVPGEKREVKKRLEKFTLFDALCLHREQYTYYATRLSDAKEEVRIVYDANTKVYAVYDTTVRTAKI